MIVLDKVTKRFGPKILFENVSLQFDPGKRYGLAGANGAGKSTLVKMLAGEEDTDAGSISMPGTMRLGVLRQNHFAYDEQRILDVVLMGNEALWAAMAEKERLLAGDMTDAIGMRLGELEVTIAEENGYTAESEAAELLTGLGLGEERQLEPMRTLAPGYKLRVLLAQVLFGKPDVLLLDEPTNHLDLESIHWLEDFLLGYRGTLVVVSHDRHFLDAISTHVADVDYRTITIYTGNYSQFVASKYENRQRAEQQSQAAKKKMGELQSFVDRFGAHASKSKQAQSRVKQIEKLADVLETSGPKRSSLVRPFIRFEFDKPSGRDVLRMEGVNKSFGDHHVLVDATLHLNRGDRVAVIGPNGVGKSTLLKVLVGACEKLAGISRDDLLKPDSGELRWGHDVVVDYFAQDHHEALGERSKGQTAFEWLYSFDRKAPQEAIRSILGRLLFSGEAALKPVEALSGGECARLLLAKILLVKPNVIVLDEPTNHLDIESIEGLVLGLEQFAGTVVFVSHDRHFVARLATRVVELSPGKLSAYGGTYDEYLERAGHDFTRR